MIDTFSLSGKYRIIKTDSKTGEVISTTPFYKNMIVDGVNTGFNLFLKRLFGTNTYSLNVTHLDIGTVNTPPTLADTSLGNAISRAGIATKSIDGSSVTFRFFYPDIDLPNGEYIEVGLFIDGTDTVDTGQMFTRSLLNAVYTKATGEDTSLEYIISKN